MPRSSALWTTRRVASRSMRPPKLLQPSPTSVTDRPDFPRLRSSTLLSPNRTTGRLNRKALEQLLRNQPDDQHDETPEARHIDRLLAREPGGQHRPGSPARAGGEEDAGLAPGHAGVEEARLDRSDRHARAEQPVAQPGGEGGEARLGGAIDIVLEPPAIAGHRAQNDDPAAASRLEQGGEVEQQRRGAGEARIDGADGELGIVLHGRLVGHVAEAEENVELAFR